jgi:hypothetical protein
MTKSDQVFGEKADDQAQADPRVHPPVKQPQLGRAGLELQEAQRGAEDGETAVGHEMRVGADPSVVLRMAADAALGYSSAPTPPPPGPFLPP